MCVFRALLKMDERFVNQLFRCGILFKPDSDGVGTIFLIDPVVGVIGRGFLFKRYGCADAAVVEFNDAGGVFLINHRAVVDGAADAVVCMNRAAVFIGKVASGCVAAHGLVNLEAAKQAEIHILAHEFPEVVVAFFIQDAHFIQTVVDIFLLV